MIDSSEISVVIQGAISDETKKVIGSVKKFLPHSEIILSTWMKSNVENLKYDKVIFSQDPGATVFRLNGQKHNLNRQILSTFNGVKNAKRKYILKLRSDTILVNKNFLKYFDMFPKRDLKYKIFNKRIIITNIYTRNSSPEFKCLFHPSDWVMFGLSQDIYKMWNIPLAPEPETSQWFKTHKKPPFDMFPDFLTRYHAEQYIWINVLKKNGVNFKFDNYLSYSKKLIQISDRSIFNNFVILDYKPKYSFLNLKYPKVSFDNTLIYFYDFIFAYKKYSDKNFKISKILRIKNNKKIIKNINKIKKHILRTYKPFNIILKFFEEIFAVIFYVFELPIIILLESVKLLNDNDN